MFEIVEVYLLGAQKCLAFTQQMSHLKSVFSSSTEARYICSMGLQIEHLNDFFRELLSRIDSLWSQGNSLRGIVNCSGVARKVQNILLDNTLSQACLITIFSLLQHETKNSFYKQCWPSMVFHSENNSYLWKVLLDQRPKFYRRSRRFKTYGYGYGGQSLRLFLRPKVLFVVFLVFSKMEAEMCFSSHRCHLRLN